MTTLTKANQQISAQWNRKLTIQLLRQHHGLSRSQLAEMTSLRGSTLTYIVRELTSRGVVRPAGKLPSKSVGQKQILLEINPDLGWVMGVELARERAHVMVVNAAGGVVHTFDVPTRGPLESAPAQVRTGADELLAKLGRPAGELLGVGLGVPGVVDCVRGVVLKSSPLSATNVPLQRIAEDALGCRVVVDHDANLGALAEGREGSARDVSDYIYFLANAVELDGKFVFRGFGSALFLDGHLHRGVHFAAGELDTSIEPADPPALTAAEMSALALPDGPMTGELERLADGIGGTAAHLINLLDPQALVIGGSHPIRNTAFLARVRDQARGRLIPIDGRAIDIQPSGLGAMATCRGGAEIVLDAVLAEQGARGNGNGNGETADFHAFNGKSALHA